MNNSDSETNQIDKNLTLIKVDPDNQLHNKSLYRFLKNRRFNISHNKLPSYEMHLKFVRKNPYRKWFLVSFDLDLIGSVYILYDNGIGIDLNAKYYFLIKEIIRKINIIIKPLNAIKSIRTDKFHINISPSNLELHEKVNEAGWVLKQYRFELS